MRMKNNYDHIANYYDRLSRFVFNNAQVSVQISQLQYIPQRSSILIVGGGSGWILKELYALHQEGLTITYVELSTKMINQAKRLHHHGNKIHFINAAIENFNTADTYDVIMTAFLFDNFKAEKARMVFSKLHYFLRKGGHWLYSDFSFDAQRKSWWQHFLLKTMYLFFKLIARVEANALPEMQPLFKKKNYGLISKKKAFSGFIESCVLKKR